MNFDFNLKKLIGALWVGQRHLSCKILFLAGSFGATPLEVKVGMSAVEVSKLADIPLLIKALVQAVDQGELDSAIDTVTAARKTKSKRGVAA